MAVFTAAGTLGASIAGFFGATVAATSFSAIAIGFAAQAALGFALNALTPKPKTRGANRGYQVNSRGAALDHQIIYGKMRVGGALIFESSDPGGRGPNAFLRQIYAHAGHPVEGYIETYIDNKLVTKWRRADNDVILSTNSPSEVPNGTLLFAEEIVEVDVDGTPIPGTESNLYVSEDDNLWLAFYDGTQTTADPDLVANVSEWTNDHVLRNTAYVQSIMAFDADIFPNGVPEITHVIKGKKVFDPRDASTAWTDNPALCIRDYLISDYGIGETVTGIDDDLVSTAANVCDTTADNGEPFFTCNGAFVTDLAPIDILEDLLTSMGGLLWHAQGEWRMKAASWVPPTLTLTEDDLRSSIAVQTRHSRRDNFNTVRGTFRGAESNWQVTDYPPVSNTDFVDADNGQESVIDFELPFTDNSEEARRIARIMLERNRQQLTINASFGLRAFELQIGDVVNLTIDRFGWVGKPFEVSGWTFGLTDTYDLQVKMTLRETAASIFDEIDDGIVYEIDNTRLEDPFTQATISNLVATNTGIIATDGTYVNAIGVTWDIDKPTLAISYTLEWKKQTDTNYNSVSLKTTDYIIPAVEDGVTYDIRVKTVNRAGISGEYVSITFTPGADETAPAVPTSVTAVGGFRYITVSWTNPADKDFSYVEVYENTSNTTSGATLIAEVGGNQYVRTNLGISETKWFFLKSVDYTGNKSGFTSGVSGTTTFIDDDDFENDIRSLFEEQGLYPIEDVSSLPASGILNRKVFNRADGKLYEWNGSSWVLVVASAQTDDLIGQITETQITDNAISTPKLQAGSVEATKIAGSTITGDKIVANTITGGLLATSGIITSTAQIENALITNAKIENAAVDTLKIAGNAATTSSFSARASELDGVDGNWRGNWATSTSYAVDDCVYSLGGAFKCINAHTSANAPDPNAGSGQYNTNWERAEQLSNNGTISVPANTTTDVLIVTNFSHGYTSGPQNWSYRISGGQTGLTFSTITSRQSMVFGTDAPVVSYIQTYTNTASTSKNFSVLVYWTGEDSSLKLRKDTTVLNLVARWR